MKNKWRIIPTSLTGLNLGCGFVAILFVFSEKSITAGWLIVLAGILDGIDGWFARTSKANGRFGVEIDSLADMVSFGVAPALLVYSHNFYAWKIWGILLCFLLSACAAFRLARFNVEAFEDQHFRGFSGLPAPMAAITMVSFFFLIKAVKIQKSGYALLPLLILVCILMVSRVQYDTFPYFTFRHSITNTIKLLFFILCVAMIIAFWRFTFFPVMITYLLHGPVFWLLKYVKT